MRTNLAAALVSFILLAPAAFSQISGFTIEEKRGDGVIFTFTGPRGTPSAAITGAPYTADEVLENVKTLADGTHVSQPRSVHHVVRDSQGRTRSDRPLLETSGDNGTKISVTEIRDPVEGFYYILDQQSKIAHRFAFGRPPAGTQLPTHQPGPVAGSEQAPNGTRPGHSTENLGNQWIEGVTAEGVRMTTTWPIGTQGNDRPIVSVYETWYSPDLKMLVRRIHSDQRMGEETFRLSNITRAEPDPSLLQPPPDYTIVDEKGSFAMTVTRH